MRSEPSGVNAIFKVTVTYQVAVYGDSEGDSWDVVQDLSPEQLSDEEVMDITYQLIDIDKDGF